MQRMMDTRTELSIGGMTCGGCANAVTRGLAGVPGVASVTVDRVSGHARVDGSADTPTLIAAVEQAGLDARPA